MKRCFWSLLAALTGLTLVAGNTSADSSSTTPITMGWDMWEPYQYINDQKQLTGLDIEVMQAITKRAGFPLKLAQLPWKRHLKAIENGSIDLAAGASITEDRKHYAYFSTPYRKERVALFIRHSDRNLYHAQSLRALLDTGFRLGVSRGYYYGEAYEAIKKNPKYANLIQEVNNYVLNYHKLLNNRIDGFLSDHVASYYTLRKEGMEKQIVAHTTPIHEADIAFMFSKASTTQETLDIINQNLAELKADGTLTEILHRYGL